MTDTNEFNVEIVDSKGTDLFSELEPELKRLHKENITLVMATTDDNQIAHASYTPFAVIDGNYYIYIANIAEHTQHVINRPIFDVLIIDDQSSTKNIYARKRVTYQVKAEEVTKGNDEFQQGIDALIARAGKTVNVLAGLGDFHLFRLTPLKGTLVTGFGKAFRLNPKDRADTTHLKGKDGNGHNTVKQA